MTHQFKKIAGLFVAAGLLVTLAQPVRAAAPVELVVGATPVPHADVLHFIAPALLKEGVKLKVVEFSDYVKPNLALGDKELDANYFQSIPYLEAFTKARNLNFEILTAVHVEPMGVYSSRHKSLADVPNGATVAIPNEPTNGGRALKVLETAGLLKVRPEAGVLGTARDVVENPKGLKIVELEAALLPRSLDDVDLAVINSNYALGAKLNPTRDSLAIESTKSPYANVVAIRAGDKRPELDKLKKVITSPEVKAFLEKTFDGAVVPVF